MDTERIAQWATGLAAWVAPDEVDLAGPAAVAYAQGGAQRAELFRTSGAVPGGFDVSDAIAAIPTVLAAVSAVALPVWNLVTSDLYKITSMAKNVSDLASLRRGATQAARAPSSPPTSAASGVADNDALRALKAVVDAVESGLRDAGVSGPRASEMTLTVVRAMLADAGGTQLFLTESASA